MLYDQAVSAMGSEAAEVLMEHLPPAGWGELATQAELRRVETSLNERIDHLEQVLRADMATLGANLRTELATAMSGVDRRVVVQTRTLMMGMIGMVLSTFGAVFGAAATFH